MKKFTRTSILSMLTCLTLGSCALFARKSSRARRNAARTTAQPTQPVRATSVKMPVAPESQPLYPGSQPQQVPAHAPAQHHASAAPAQSHAHDIAEPTSEDMMKRGQVQPHEVKAVLGVDDAAAQEIAECMNRCRQVFAAPIGESPEAIGQKITDSMNISRDTIKRHVSKGDEAHWEEHKDETWKKLYSSMQ